MWSKHDWKGCETRVKQTEVTGERWETHQKYLNIFWLNEFYRKAIYEDWSKACVCVFVCVEVESLTSIQTVLFIIYESNQNEICSRSKSRAAIHNFLSRCYVFIELQSSSNLTLKPHLNPRNSQLKKHQPKKMSRNCSNPHKDRRRRTNTLSLFGINYKRCFSHSCFKAEEEWKHLDAGCESVRKRWSWSQSSYTTFIHDELISFH